MLGKAKELEILEHAITSVVAMNAAIINIRLFPRGSNMIDKVTDKVYQALQAIFESKDSVVFAESEKTLLVCEQLLGEKDQKKPQIISFLELLLNFGIKSITFTKDLEKAELKTFLEIMSKKPEEVHNEGELQQIVEYNSLPHILIDETVYIAVHKDQQIVANLNIKDEELVKYLMGVHQGSEMDPENIKEMAKNPEWVTNVFHAGVQYLAEQKGTVPNVQLSENFVHMIRTLDHIADNIVKEEVTQQVSKSIADMDIEMISMILIQNMEGLLGDELFNHIINQIENEKFEKIAMRIKQMYDHSSSQGTYHETSSLESVHHAYQNMMNSDKGRQLQSNIQERIVHEKEEKERQLTHIKEAINRFLKGDDKAFLDKQVIHSLPSVVNQMFSKGNNHTAEAIIDRIGDGLTNDNNDMRTLLSEALGNIVNKLSSEQCVYTICRLSPKLITWIRIETSITPAYEQLCTQLNSTIQIMIQNRQFTECIPILEVFDQIDSGEIQKNESIQAIVNNLLKNIATEEVMEVLLKEFQTNEHNERNEVSEILARLGATPVDSLLDIMQMSNDRSERARILQLIPKIGHRAVPALINEMTHDGPWYYIRNLVLLLGQVGNETHVESLQLLFDYEDIRVQKEVLNSIYQIGEDKRCKTLVSLLPSVHHQLNINIVKMLGTLECDDAVQPLLDLLELKSVFTPKTKDELKENICIALGRIGSREAIPALTSIARKKSFFPFKTLSKHVKRAAQKALGEITQRADKKETTQDASETQPSCCF